MCTIPGLELDRSKATAAVGALGGNTVVKVDDPDLLSHSLWFDSSLKEELGWLYELSHGVSWYS